MLASECKTRAERWAFYREKFDLYWTTYGWRMRDNSVAKQRAWDYVWKLYDWAIEEK